MCTFAPRPFSLAVGAGVGKLFYKLNKKRRRIAAINIDLCYPELEQAARAEIVMKHFKRYGQNVVDTGLLWWASESRLNKWVRIDGLTEFLHLIEQGHNVIVITPHAVGMDLAGVVISKYHKTVSMMKPLYNDVLDWQIRKGRLRYATTKLVTRTEGLRPLIRGIKTNHLCYYIPDEDFGEEKSVFAPFFGVPTATLSTLGRMAKMTQAKVVPCFAELRDDGVYIVKLKPPLEDFPTNDVVSDAERMNQALEQGIREAPEQYLWTLRWFKTRPDGGPSPYDNV